MKLLIISAAFPPLRAGEADHCLCLAQHLADAGIDVTVLTSIGATLAKDTNFTVCPLIEQWSWRDLLRIARFTKRLRPEAALLIYTGWIYNDHPMITFLPTVLKAIRPAMRFVTQFEIDHALWRELLPTRLVRKAAVCWAGPSNVDYWFGTLFRDSDRIIALCSQHLMQFAKRSPGIEAKSLIIPPPPLLPIRNDNKPLAKRQGRERLGLDPKDFVIAFFGYVDPDKGVATLLRALHIVNTRAEHVRLVLAGGGRGRQNPGSATPIRPYQHVLDYEATIRELADQLGVAGKIVWTPGYEPGSEEVSLYLHAADVGVFPYDSGVTLNRSSLAAASAHGLSIVSTRGTFLEPAFVDGENVLLCPPKNPSALAQAIESVMRRPALRQRLEEGALELAREWFSWEKAIQKTISALEGASRS